MARYRQWFVFILLLVVAAGFIAANRGIPLRKGLDLAGGMRVVYEVDPRPGTKYTKDMQNTIVGILERRVNKSGVSEPIVQPKGDDQFIVEIPDVKDKEQIADDLRSQTNLDFVYLKNVQSKKNPNAPIRMEAPSSDEGKYKFFGPDGKELPIAEVLKQSVVELTGADLKSNSRGDIQGMESVVLIEFKPRGKDIFAEFTRRHTGEILAMVLNGDILSAPNIEEPILNGQARVSGSFTPATAQRLADNLNAGALPVPLRIVEQNVVEATLGLQYVKQSLQAGLIGLAFVVTFMVIYYLLPGLVAVFALAMYTLFTIAIFKLMQVTMTLPGFAGFILSIGMAVDANILIFERTKEELRGGKTLHSAIDAGFNRAWTAILDSNVCTLITCFILVMFTSGPVVGFAKTLAIGVLVSMFTAVTVSRTLLHMVSNMGFAQNAKLYGLGLQWGQARVGHVGFDVIGRSNLWFGLSIASIIVGMYFLITSGLKPGIDFTGGSMIQASVPATATAPQIQDALRSIDVIGTVQIAREQSGGATAYIRTKELDTEKAKELGTAIASKIEGAKVLRADKVGSAISSEITRNAIIAVIIASLAIMLYLSVRFAFGGFAEGLKFGICALIALLHDILVVLGASALFGKLFGWEIDGAYVTAVLTVVGFSVHDTIVIFDRIRENQRNKLRGESFDQMVNRSILQSFARSINTSFTVVLVLTALMIWGGSVIRHFTAVLLVGIISGTYSSIFNASPLLVMWDRFTHGQAARPTVELKPLVPASGGSSKSARGPVSSSTTNG
ncbi:MAG: protein translocase subunit SecD, partial [Armatimonadota bacterium]